MSLHGGREHPQDPALGNPYPRRALVMLVSTAALKCSASAALPRGLGSDTARGPLLRCQAALTATGTRQHALPGLLPPAGLPKQHVRSRPVSRAKPRLRVRLVSHTHLLCQGSDPVLVRKQTHCDALGSVALSHPLEKPMLWIRRAGLEA